MEKETAYLKIPFSVLSQADLTLSTKVLLAQILEYSKLGSCFATNTKNSSLGRYFSFV